MYLLRIRSCQSRQDPLQFCRNRLNCVWSLHSGRIVRICWLCDSQILRSKFFRGGILGICGRKRSNAILFSLCKYLQSILIILLDYGLALGSANISLTPMDFSSLEEWEKLLGGKVFEGSVEMAERVGEEEAAVLAKNPLATPTGWWSSLYSFHSEKCRNEWGEQVTLENPVWSWDDCGSLPSVAFIMRAYNMIGREPKGKYTSFVNTWIIVWEAGTSSEREIGGTQ